MAFSAMPFWKWALTPQKVSYCPFALQLFLKVADAMLLGKVFKGSFGFHCFFGGELCHQVDILQS
jgi:hypothetical protein